MFNKKIEVVESSYSKVFRIPHSDDVIVTQEPVRDPPFSFRKQVVQQVQKLTNYWLHLVDDRDIERVRFLFFHSAMSNTVYKISLAEPIPQNPFSFIIRIYGTGTDASYQSLVKSREDEGDRTPPPALTPVSSKSNLYQFENTPVEPSTEKAPTISLSHSLESFWMFLLAEQGVSPHVYGQFGNGRIEETVFDGSPLTAATIRQEDISRETARQLGRLHAATDSLRRLAIKLYREYYHNDPRLSELLNRDLNYWNVILRSFHQVAAALPALPAFRFVELLPKVAQVEELVHRVQAAQHVFCHSDLQYGNLMASDQPLGNRPAVILIDFEYGAFGPRGFDIANHFFEWMCDYTAAQPHRIHSAAYPAPDQVGRFLRAYLLAAATAASASSSCSSSAATSPLPRSPGEGMGVGLQSVFSRSVSLDEWTAADKKADSLEATAAAVDGFLREHGEAAALELRLFTLVSDLKWAFWGVQQHQMRSLDSAAKQAEAEAVGSQLDSDDDSPPPAPPGGWLAGGEDPHQFYLDYAAMRIGHFWDWQEAVLSAPAAAHVFPVSNFSLLLPSP